MILYISDNIYYYASAGANTPVGRASVPSAFCNSFGFICLSPDSFVNNSSSTAAINALDTQNPIRV